MPVSHVALPVSVRAIPLNTRVFVSTKGCCGYVYRHLMNGRDFAGYRVRYDNNEFEIGDDDIIADHSPSEVFTLIDESTPRIKWPAVALPRNHLASAVQGFNDKVTQRAGSSKVIGVCLNVDKQVAFYKMTLKGTDFFFHVRDVKTTGQPQPNNAPPSSPPQASQRAEDEPQPEQAPVQQAPNAPPSSPAQASQRAEAEPQPEQWVQQDTNAPASSPQQPVQHAHSTGRQRSCKDCGRLFPFVARKKLCGQCGVQPSAASPDLPEGSSASSCSDSDTAPQVAGGKRKRATKFNPRDAQVVSILYVIAADCPYTHHRDSQKACTRKVLHRNAAAAGS